MKKLVGITLMLSLFAGVAYAMLGSSGSWRYKLTLVVDDHGKEYSGSSVVQITAIDQSMIPAEGSQTHLEIKGEATAVEIGDKGVLFALLGSDGGSNDPEHLVCGVFPMPGETGCAGSRAPAAIPYYSHLRGTRPVPFAKLPMLVRFRDLRDPKTVEKVDPNDLAKSFGAGVTLKSATLEMTKEPVTMRVEKQLIWLNERKNMIGYLGGWPNDASKTYLNGGEFSKGIIQ